MDSPESSNSTTTNCEIAHTEESPVFNFLSNLSPIQTVRAPPATQTFPELSSPPLVFTSPQLNHHRRSAFLQRAQFHRASPAIFANFTGHDEDDNGKYRKLNIQLSTRLEKATDRHSPENDLTGSPAVSPEQFLADIVDAESADPKFSNNSISEKSESIDQPLDIGTVLKENIGNRVRKTISRTSEQLAHVPDVISRQTEEALEENMLLDVNAVEKGTNQVDGVSSDHCREIELTIQTNEDIMTENVEAKQSDHSDESYPFFSGSVEIRKENEILAKATGADLTEPALMRAQKDREAYLHEVLRRCLQFEDSQHKVISSQTAKSILSSEELRLMSSETPATPDNDTHDEVAPPMFRPRNRLNPAIKIPKPSGIGLHLNSIVNAVQAGSGSKVNLRSADWGNFSIVGKKSMHANESHPVDCSNYPTMLPPVENVSAIIDSNRDRHESHASAGVTSPLSVSTHIAKPSDDSDIVSSLEYQSMPGIKRKYTEKGGDSKDFFTSSPQKKRMKASDSGEGGGCKRCNCKKSKCLKLYCDCFASGLYCAEPCACHDCFNTPEYESTVIETRQKIESRDPLAFAPRVVKRVTVQPLSIHGEDGTPSTPSSERHKRGCKCKKSMCLKKYCECYQANVGCSDGCQCEGCQNVFGQKGGMSTQKSILALREEHCPVKNVFCEEDTIEVADGAGLEKRIITASGNLVNPTEVFNTHHLTPLTPAFQSSNRRKDASKSWFPSQSRETGFTSVAPYMIAEGSPLNSDDINNSMATEDTRELLLDLSSFGNDSQTNLQKCADDSLYKKRQIFPLGSTNMPLPHYSGTKLDRDVKFDSDDTPEMLKESSTFITGVKICSPNKKRVSPPHAFGSISLAGIRTGRKFILKSVPTFPPLTPCIDSRSVAVDKSNEPQNHHVNNDACI